MSTFIKRLSLTLLIGSPVLWGCTSENDREATPAKEVIFGKMEFSDGWVRPGAQGKTTAAYLTISNGTASTDTLIGVFSDAAESAEIHESYEDDAGIMGMRPAGKQTIKSGGRMQLKPGVRHIMMRGLKRELASGDTVDISLEFGRVGVKTLSLPVKVQQ